MTPTHLERLLARHRAGDVLRLHVFRRDELMEFSLRLGDPVRDRHHLQLLRQPNRLREEWLQ
ncbi:MAG: hypothetical protein AW08_03682 [Candidatus Accumulibacter adjunctus]|uniref:Uncharacterized protein n=1 Tax=Candidatus Accumulibacter adjunctus TaxID=1454001 RepID=A0A011NJA2_9PROT|nr:MAG: hypothetical protein AW08_03682 [Candidatus Accumulibacter adjunctus]